MHRHVVIPATLDAVSEFTAGLDDLCGEIPLSLRATLILAVQELCVNIVKHAYAGTTGNIEIDLQLSDERMAIVMCDQAPDAYSPPDQISPPDPFELPEGGLGMFIIHQAFDQVEYQRSGSDNCWRLVKRFGVEHRE